MFRFSIEIQVINRYPKKSLPAQNRGGTNEELVITSKQSKFADISGY